MKKNTNKAKPVSKEIAVEGAPMIAKVTWTEAKPEPAPEPAPEQWKSISLTSGGRRVSTMTHKAGGVFIRFETMEGLAHVVTDVRLSDEALQALVDLAALRGIKYGTFIKTDDVQVFESRWKVLTKEEAARVKA